MDTSLASIKNAFSLLKDYDDKLLKQVRDEENAVNEILDSALHSFKYNSIDTANRYRAYSRPLLEYRRLCH